MVSFTISFIFGYENRYETLDYDNSEHLFRFLLVYSISLVLCVIFPFIDKSGWLYVSVAIALALFSNSIIGITTVSGFITISSILSNNPDPKVFFVYILSAMLSIAVFKNIDENFDVTLSILISQIGLFILESCCFIFLENKDINAEMFILPTVNIVINSLVLFYTLKYFNDNVANKQRNRYAYINDQEYSVLVELKEKSKDEYMRSIHTAYLTERIAKACNADVDLAKNLAYYHRIKYAFGYSQNEMKDFVVSHKFPPEAAKTLLEFYDKNKPLIKKEACIVFLSDKLISTLGNIFTEDNKKVINYNELIDSLLSKQYIIDALEESDLSKKDYKYISEIMKKETLYYDFLR